MFSRRTTKGMMLYATALRLLAAIEAEDAMNQHPDSFIESKFRCARALPRCVHADAARVMLVVSHLQSSSLDPAPWRCSHRGAQTSSGCW